MTSSEPGYLLKAPPANAVTLGVKAATQEFGGGGTRIQSITDSLSNSFPLGILDHTLSLCRTIS